MNARRNQTIELYDLSIDPSEQNNITSDHPAVVAKLSKKLRAWVNELPESSEKKNEKRKKKKRCKS